MNESAKYFEATVQFLYEQDNGKTKKVNERYLVDAMSCTEAEAKCVNKFMAEAPNIEFSVKVTRESKILGVF